LVDSRKIVVPPLKLVLAFDRVWRAVIRVASEIVIPISHATHIIDARVVRSTASVRNQRIVTATDTAVIVPRVIVVTMLVPVVVPKVIVTISATNEQMQKQAARADRDAGTIAEVCPPVGMVVEIEWAIKLATRGEGIIPITSLIQAAARRPDVACRHPDPVVPKSFPMSGLPTVTAVVINPTAGSPKVVIGRGRADGTAFKAFRWVREILEV